MEITQQLSLNDYNITQVDLSDNALKATGFVILDLLLQNPNLKHIKLANNWIPKVSAATRALLENLSPAVQVDLTGNYDDL